MLEVHGPDEYLPLARDLERAAARALNGHGPDRRSTLRRLDVAQMVREQPPPVPWAVEGIAVEGALALITGREGEGKSLLAASLAVGVAAGETIAGMPCGHGSALIVDAENGAYEIHRRVHSLGLPASGVEVVEADGFHLGRDLDELRSLIAELRPTLVVLDSFRSLWPGGDENDPAAVASVLDPLRNVLRAEGAAGLLLHHLSKREGDYRGSTAIGAAVELGFKLDRALGDPDRAFRRRLTCWKCRPGPEPERRWLQLHVERGRVYVDGAEPFESDGEAARHQRPARAELAPQLLKAAGAPIEWPRLAEAIGRDRRDGTARRLRDDLLAAGELRQLEDGRLEKVGATDGTDGTLDPGVHKPDTEGVPVCQPPIGGRAVAPRDEDAS